jgi:hypothetical protein
MDSIYKDSLPIFLLLTMVKNTKEFSRIEKIKNLQSSVRDQAKSLNLNEQEPRIKQLIIDLINKYGDIKTILNLQELLSPSNATRSKNIPRPQNPWVLYRKNISRGLNVSVGETSGIASCLWNEISEREKQFWFKLSHITKEIHSIEFPNYKYSPVRPHDQKSSKENIPQNTDLDTSMANDSKIESNTISKIDILTESDQNKSSKENISQNTYLDTSMANNPEIESNIISGIDISPKSDVNMSEIDIDMSEVDIDMVAAELFQSDFMDVDMDPSLFMDQSLIDSSYTDPFLMDPLLIDPSLIDPSFSFIDPSLIDYSLEFTPDNYNL